VVIIENVKQDSAKQGNVRRIKIGARHL
jgi:hypothetical protein